MWKSYTIVLALLALPSLAAADYTKINEKSAFLDLVIGKTLTRPFVKLEISAAGEISGRGAKWDINGKWTWEDGYFCRNLVWGGDELGYNCQEVGMSNGKIRFTSEKGEGDSAGFSLR